MASPLVVVVVVVVVVVGCFNAKKHIPQTGMVLGPPSQPVPCLGSWPSKHINASIKSGMEAAYAPNNTCIPIKRFWSVSNPQ